jgi:hypothetical protein
MSLEEIRGFAQTEGMRIETIRSYADEVDASVARRLPERLSMRGYEILRHLEEVEVREAAERAKAAVEGSTEKEYLSSSLLVLCRG